jgi:hypothetical protein
VAEHDEDPGELTAQLVDVIRRIEEGGVDGGRTSEEMPEQESGKKDRKKGLGEIQEEDEIGREVVSVYPFEIRESGIAAAFRTDVFLVEETGHDDGRVEASDKVGEDSNDQERRNKPGRGRHAIPQSGDNRIYPDRPPWPGLRCPVTAS